MWHGYNVVNLIKDLNCKMDNGIYWYLTTTIFALRFNLPKKIGSEIKAKNLKARSKV